jgi:hypothetical protein
MVIPGPIIGDGRVALQTLEMVKPDGWDSMAHGAAAALVSAEPAEAVGR